MSDYIPFDIQSKIIQRLPVKSLVQFRSVSKQWKSFIEDPQFIKTYHINHPQHRLLVVRTINLPKSMDTCTSFVDDNTFPQQKFPLTPPKSLSSLVHVQFLGLVNGLFCFYGFGFVDSRRTRMAVLWNPTIRKYVDIAIPNIKMGDVYAIGACPDTSDLKLVKISNASIVGGTWEVVVFTLSTRLWKPVYAPFKSCCYLGSQVFIDGVLYISTIYINHGSSLKKVILFDLKSEKFGQVCLPERLVNAHHLQVAKVNDSLGLVEYFGGEVLDCCVWTRKEGANKPFTKLYNVKVDGNRLKGRVLGFSNNGEVLIELDDPNSEETSIHVYEPSSGRINGIGIIGKPDDLFYVGSYMETLALL